MKGCEKKLAKLQLKMQMGNVIEEVSKNQDIYVAPFKNILMHFREISGFRVIFKATVQHTVTRGNDKYIYQY